MNETATALDVTIKREQPAAAQPGPALWLYSYTTPVDLSAANGWITHRAGQYVEHGTHLASLLDMLRQSYGRDVRITEAWKLCALCGEDATGSFCQVCKRTICAGCLTDHSHGLDGREEL